MKILRFYLCFMFASIASGVAGEKIESLGELMVKGTEFLLYFEQGAGSSTLSVKIAQEPDVVWSVTWENDPAGKSYLHQWKIREAYISESLPRSVALLLSTDEENLYWWVKAVQSNGKWVVAFNHRFWGAKDMSAAMPKCKLSGIDSLTVEYVDGKSDIFTRDSAGKIFKNGGLYENGP